MRNHIKMPRSHTDVVNGGNVFPRMFAWLAKNNFRGIHMSQDFDQ